MQKLLLAVALSVALLGSATAARPAQSSDSMCSLPANWDQADFAAQAFASVNAACPSAAGLQNEEDDTCVPCVCGAYQLFSGALDHPVIRSDDRSKMTSPMSISLFGEVVNSCIDNNAKKFVKPLDIQAGLSDCLSSTDSPVKNGAQLAALCATWNAQSQQAAGNQEQPVDVIPEAQQVDEHIRNMMESRMLQQEESSAGSLELSMETSDGGLLGVYPPHSHHSPPYPPIPPAPPGGYYPPSPPKGTYPTPPGGMYPPSYPLPPAPPGGYSPPSPASPPPRPSAAGITMAGMMPLIMGLVSAFLMATMML